MHEITKNLGSEKSNSSNLKVSMKLFVKTENRNYESRRKETLAVLKVLKSRETTSWLWIPRNWGLSEMPNLQGLWKRTIQSTVFFSELLSNNCLVLLRKQVVLLVRMSQCRLFLNCQRLTVTELQRSTIIIYWTRKKLTQVIFKDLVYCLSSFKKRICFVTKWPIMVDTEKSSGLWISAFLIGCNAVFACDNNFNMLKYFLNISRIH